MDWPQIAELCQTELQRLRADGSDFAVFFPVAHEVPMTFLGHERDTNEAVEVAVRVFAAHRSWPPLSPVERMMLCFRLDFAASLATLLAQQPAPWTDAEDSDHDEERIRWLMLFAWENEGFSTLHDNLRRLISHETGA
jgi:hypothetical protein